jgi:hypothetical protein
MASPLGVDAAKSTHLAAMALDQNRKRSSPAAPAAAPSLATRLSSWVAWVRGRVQTGCHCVQRLRKQAQQLPHTIWFAICWLSRRWRPLAAAVGVGCTLGGLAYLAGPWLCTGAGGLAGFTTTLALQARAACKRLFASAPACLSPSFTVAASSSQR